MRSSSRAALLATSIVLVRAAEKGMLLLISFAMLLVGGTTSARGQSALDGFDPNANDLVRVVVVQPDGKILIGGDFTMLTPNGGAAVTRNHIARLNADGSLDIAFNPNADISVTSIAVQADGKILAGGAFTSIGGQTRNSIARLDATTGLADQFDPNPNDWVLSLAVQADGKILVGGYFSNIGGQTRNCIARLDPTTGLADSFDPNASNIVSTITVQPDGKILVAGVFNSIGGQTRTYIARLDAATGMADSFDANADGGVYSLAVQADGKILAGGGFNSIGGQPRNHIARLDPTTGLADSFNPNAQNQVHSVAVQADGKILVGGFFTRIGGQTRRNFARLYAMTGLADSFNANVDAFVLSIAVQADGKTLVGGYFSSVGGQTRNCIARFSGDDLPTTLGNISTRLRVETGDNALIGGFIITGTQPKKVIVRAIGPSLPFGGVLIDPILELRDSFGQLIRSNDNWRTDQEQQIIKTGIPPGNDLESAVVETLPANGSAYTAIVRGANDGTGVGLVEVYDLDQFVDSTLTNISTRGLVQTRNDVMIAGTIVLGETAQRVLVRAICPSLPLSGCLSNPTLELRDVNGALIRANDNWRSDQEKEITATGLPPSNDLESALIETLSANGAAYTAIVRGVNDTTGVALVEVYGLGQAPTPNPTPTPTATPPSTPPPTPTSPPNCEPIALVVSAPSTATMGVPFSFTVTVWCPFTPDPNYSGSVHFTSADPAAELHDGSIDHGVGTFTATLNTTGSWTIAATTATLAGTSNSIQVGGSGVPCTENFDKVVAPALPANWVATNPIAGDGVLFLTTTATPDSAPNAAFVPDQDGVSDKVLDLPGVTVNSPSASISFRHKFDSEMSDGVFWDGGVLEVSTPTISNGDFLDITDPKVGGSIISGGYTGEISGDADNPLGGRMAWSGHSEGYIDTVVNLGPKLNGTTIGLRWRFGSDVAVAAPGWWIDNFSTVGASCP